MAVTGPDFISLQVRDLERSAAFYQQYLGLKRSDAGPPHAVVFDTKPRTIVSAPIDGPFGRTFTFADPDGYQITLHDRG
ncbi:MAG: VOC family protein [Solirubrobacteraceae bacterium]